MTKEREKIEGKTSEPVANCDQLSVVTGHQLSGQEEIAQLIMNVRGMQVMVDRDLAVLYGVETKRLSRTLPFSTDERRNGRTGRKLRPPKCVKAFHSHSLCLY